MKRLYILPIVLLPLIFTVLTLRASGQRDPGGTTPVPSAVSTSNSTSTLQLRKTTLVFEPNAGQVDSPALYLAHTTNGVVLFGSAGVDFTLSSLTEPGTPEPAFTPSASSPSSSQQSPSRVIAQALGWPRRPPQPLWAPPTTTRQHWLGANPGPSIAAGTALPGKISYYRGRDPTKWQVGLTTYAAITYPDLYPGITLRYTGVGDRLQALYTVAAGADPTRVRWLYDGVQEIHVDPAGNLRIILPAPPIAAGRSAQGGANMITVAPVVWQQIVGQRVTIPARYQIASDKSISIILASYNHNQPLMLDTSLIVAIDPTLTIKE
ncbi:MAG TPA: hypothetical protein VKY74_14580 [Chloroflexia bacterium]|nr:hypothetical protein [Chloroflexia bacterium]